MAIAAANPRVRRRDWRAIVVPYLYLSPLIVLFVVFRVYPLVYGLIISFTNARLGKSEFAFIGLSNYEKLLVDDRFQISLVNTGVYTIESTLPILGIPLLLAVVLNRGVSLRSLLRGAFFFPFSLSVVTVALVWGWLLDSIVGPFNYYLNAVGIPTHHWLGEPGTAMGAIVVTSLWWVTGYYLVIYLAALQDIPQHIYEAAAIDGASGWQTFWGITLPLLRPIYLYVVVIHIIGSFQIFGQVFVLTRGGPGDATRTVVQHIYETGFRDLFFFGSASAMSWVLFMIIMIFSLMQFKLLPGRAEISS